MSDFDENIAELRGIEYTTFSNPSSKNSASKANQDLESQQQTSPSVAEATVATPLLQDQQQSSDPLAESQPSSTESPRFTMPSPLFFTLSTVYGASSVVLGAFGAHALKRQISDPSRIANWSTAAHYQLVHSVALLATSLVLPHRAQRIPAALFVAGMTMFSGSIYLLTLDPQRFKALGPVTPLGGLCLLGGWIGLGFVGRRFVPLK